MINFYGKKKHLTLLYATTRFRYGSLDCCSPSRFLKDIDPRYLNMSSAGFKPSWGSLQSSSFSGEDSRPVLRRREQTSSQRFQDKRIFEQQNPVSRPWQQGKFQKVTDSMLKDSVQEESATLKVGNVIEHERFGIGSVLSVEGSGDSAKARIKFLNVGEKTLLLKFARYKILK